jgi:3-phenylpropionate/trans-cinnamate dioxygenase ferredoxin subunit
VATYRIELDEEIRPGQLRRVEAGGVAICVARTEAGELYAIADACTHEDWSLADGELIGNEVECPLHFSRFDVRTGAVTAPPALRPAQTFPVTVDDENIYLRVSEPD